jgi:hypothetical protein
MFIHAIYTYMNVYSSHVKTIFTDFLFLPQRMNRIEKRRDSTSHCFSYDVGTVSHSTVLPYIFTKYNLFLFKYKQSVCTNLMWLISHCFLCCLSYSSVSEDAGVEPITVCHRLYLMSRYANEVKRLQSSLKSRAKSKQLISLSFPTLLSPPPPLPRPRTAHRK